MPPTTFNILVYILIPILTAVLGGWVGAFFGSKFQEYKEEKKMSELRGIAIKALTIIKKYSKQTFKNAEDEFNTSLTITDKRCIIVLLHKLGNPVWRIREAGKKYVKEVLSKSMYNKDKKQVTYPNDWLMKFGLGEYFAIRILHEQACIDILYDQRGNAIPEKMDQMLREIDMGIWDNCLFGNYEMYRNAKAQIEMSTVFQSMAMV